MSNLFAAHHLTNVVALSGRPMSPPVALMANCPLWSGSAMPCTYLNRLDGGWPKPAFFAISSSRAPKAAGTEAVKCFVVVLFAEINFLRNHLPLGIVKHLS